MKRCILVSIRENVDKETSDKLLFLTLYRLPSKMKNGGLWHSKSSEALVNVCINATRDLDRYNRFKDIKPGALFDITFGVNDLNNKTYVAICEFVVNTDVYSDSDVYL